MVIEQKVRPPLSGIVYGEIIYWGVWLSSLIVVIGSGIAFLTTANYIDPLYSVSLIWEGMPSEKIWEGAIGAMPHKFWYLLHLKTGDGLAAFGLALGIFSVIPALVSAAIILIIKKERFFAFLALFAAVIVFISMAGIAPFPS